MKKFITTILAFVYISTSIGSTLHMHYCMGKLAGWDIGYNTSRTCGKCGMEKKDKTNNGCCRDEDSFIKNNTDQSTAEAGFQLIQLSSTTLPDSFVEIPVINLPSVTEESLFTYSPPRSSSIAVYILNRTFRI